MRKVCTFAKNNFIIIFLLLFGKNIGNYLILCLLFSFFLRFIKIKIPNYVTDIISSCMLSNCSWYLCLYFFRLRLYKGHIEHFKLLLFCSIAVRKSETIIAIFYSHHHHHRSCRCLDHWQTFALWINSTLFLFLVVKSASCLYFKVYVRTQLDTYVTVKSVAMLRRMRRSNRNRRLKKARRLLKSQLIWYLTSS